MVLPRRLLVMVFPDKEGRREIAVGGLTSVGGYHPAHPESKPSGDEKAE